MTRKPLDIYDVYEIADGTAREFRACSKRVAKSGGKRFVDDGELSRISGEVESLVIRLLGEYLRDYEAIRDRESLVPVSEGGG